MSDEIPTEALQAAARAFWLLEHPGNNANGWATAPVDERVDYTECADAAVTAAAPYLIAEGRRQRDTELLTGAVEAWGSDPATAAAEIRQSATIMRPAAAARHRAIADGLEAGRLTPAQAWRQLDETPALMARYERELRAKIAAEIRAEAQREIDTQGSWFWFVHGEAGLKSGAEWAARIAEGTDHAELGTAWQPGDPVYPPRPAWLVCACGTEVLWAPDLPDDVSCPECGEPMSPKTAEHG